MKSISCCFFDLDGTLADTDPDIRGAWRAAIADEGLVCPRFEEDFLAGPPFDEMTAILFPGRTDVPELAARLRERFAAHYDHDDFPFTKEYPGVLDAARALKAGGARIYIVTNKRHAGTLANCAHFGWDRIFDGAYSTDMYRATDGVLKKGALLGRIMSELAVEPSECLMIGDTTRDFEAAAAAGIRSVAVTWGYGKPEEFLLADAVVSRPEQLLSVPVAAVKRELHRALWGHEEWLFDDGKLLIKKICADDRLSVQVHPNDETQKTVGGRAKTEMWCVLKDGPIFAGFRPGVTAADVERAVADGSFEELMVRFDAKAGECYFIPGGLVHAIGEGTWVYEVQQSSNTTFRLYDWGRVDAQGRPRQLHVREALAAMDIALPPPVPSASVKCPYFDFRASASGEVAAEDRERCVYDPEGDRFRVFAPGAGAVFPNPVFVTA